MTPIVNGLQAQFEDDIAFRSLNALDGSEGQESFEFLDLPGHPSVVIFDSSGNETYRGFGILEESVVRQALTDVLDSG